MRTGTVRGLLRVASLAVSCLLAGGAAEARGHHHAGHGPHGRAHGRHYAMAGGAHVIQCVAFAKANSDIELSGNAANWWDNAAGVYARGSAPEVGSVLNFRANGRMRLGHVAVVTDVVDSRTIQIDQSHWNARGISRDVSVVDVSENNDWTAVRVELGHGDSYGSIYPTYGFIYARPDSSGRVITARNDRVVPILGNRAPIDLRGTTQVAEMPASATVLAPQAPGVLSDDGPNRSIR